MIYDFEVDSTEATPEACAEAILSGSFSRERTQPLGGGDDRLGIAVAREGEEVGVRLDGRFQQAMVIGTCHLDRPELAQVIGHELRIQKLVAAGR